MNDKKKRSYALKDLTGRAKRNRGFTLIMATLEHFSERDQDTLLQEIAEELEDQRLRAADEQAKESDELPL